MRILEILLLSILFLFALSIFVEKKPRWIHLLPAFSLVVALIHVFVEGQRWQMWPLYSYSALLFVLTLKRLASVRHSSRHISRRTRPVFRVVGGFSSTLLLMIVSLPPLLVPVFKLPSPTGPYDVGIKYDLFVDQSRPEPLTQDPTDFQEISVQVNYPAKITSTDSPLRYWDNAATIGKIVSTFWGGLPSFLFNHFSLVGTHSYLNADLPTGEQEFPVLVFNHGSLGFPSLNTALLEELASNGFIVFSIGHADYSPFFIEPGGGIRPFDPDNEALQQKMEENDDPEVRSIFRQLMRSDNLDEQRGLLREFLERNPRNQESLFRWADDISFALNEVERLNNGDGLLAGRLDLDAIGVLGVSFGGAASIQVCLNDERCKAAVSMDCPQFGNILDNDVNQPIMYMSSEQYNGKNDLFLQLKRTPLYMVMIKNTTHQNFSDLSIWGKLFGMQMLGEINGEVCLHIQNKYILAFFDKYLRGFDSGLLDSPPENPDVVVRSRDVR